MDMQTSPMGWRGIQPLPAAPTGDFSYPRSIAKIIESVMVNHYSDRQFTLLVAWEDAGSHIVDQHGYICDFVKLGDE
jgi:hypothetical protein